MEELINGKGKPQVIRFLATHMVAAYKNQEITRRPLV